MKRQKGATLLELLIYVAVLSIIFLVIGETLTTLIFTQEKIEARKTVDRELEFAVKKIQQSIELASAISGSYPSNTLTLTVGGQAVSYYVSSGILEKNTGGTIVDLTSNKVVVAAGSGNLFYEIENPSANPTVQIKMKVSYISNDPQLQNIQAQTQTSFALRE